jgi:teichoic acid ribitol-phosphate primase
VMVLARVWLVRVAYALARLLPRRRTVVLATAHRDRIDGNLRAIHDELALRHPDVSVIVLAYSARGGVRGVLLEAFKSVVAAYHLATSSAFIVDDYFFPIYAVPRAPRSTVIQTWHACGALKKFGHSLVDKSFGAASDLAGRVRIHANYDVCLASSRATAECYVSAFRQPLERFVWSLGIPRTDALVGRERAAEANARVRARYGIPADRRIVLYAPTFRGERADTARDPGILDLRVLNETLGDDHVVLLRMHPFVRDATRIDPALAGFAIDASSHEDINDLMLASDALITDYSSVVFEFALLERPIAVFAPDHDTYERERGFYFDYRAEGPGPVFETTRELVDYLRAGSFDVERVRRFREKWLDVADGHATERFIQELIVPALAR